MSCNSQIKKLNVIVVILISTFLVVLLSCKVKKQGGSKAQNPSPMEEYIRRHERVTSANCKGRRINWELQNKKLQLFIPKNNTADSIDLIIHFHGLSKVTEFAICQKKSQVMVTVSGGSGSSSYEKLFVNGDNFTDLLNRIRNELGTNQISSITLSGWSAGYGAIRALILRYEELIDNIILLDGIHASYIPENKVLYEGGKIDSTDLYAFQKFAQKAKIGEKRMLITHSSIFPGTYASTTECTDYLIDKLNLMRRATLKQGPIGMQQVGEVIFGKFYLLSYAGNTAPDHIDHLHGLGYFLNIIFKG